MSGEYPFLKATKPDGTQFTIQLEDIITEQGSDNFISIGRQSNNHIVLPDPHKKISRHHCSLQYRKNRWWIVDDNSANGTFLQREIDQREIDVRSEDAVSLRSGDYILILGKLSISKKPIFWRLEFIDPAETSQVFSLRTVHSFEYSLNQQTLFRNFSRRQDVVPLGALQLALIHYMSSKNYENSDQIVICEHDELIKAIWKDDNSRDIASLTHLVWQVREKIELDSGEPQFLKTVQGRGYYLDIKIVE